MKTVPEKWLLYWDVQLTEDKNHRTEIRIPIWIAWHVNQIVAQTRYKLFQTTTNWTEFDNQQICRQTERQWQDMKDQTLSEIQNW